MDPTRFLDADEDRFESRLLGSARADAPPRGALRRAEAALGFGATAGMVAAATATGTAKAATAHGVVAQVGVASVVKWLGIGVVSGVVVTGGLSYGVPAVLPTFNAPSAQTTNNDVPSKNRPAPRKTTARQVTAAKELSLPVPPSLTEDNAPNAESSPAVRSPVARAPSPVVLPRPSSSQPSPPAALAALGAEPQKSVPTPSLSGELAILERARHALLAQRPEVVLRELDSYARARSTGVFDSEAEILATEALLQQGNVGAAVSRATRALARAPSGPHAARLREIVALGKP